MARWLVDSGAGRVVLNGRSEPSDEAQALIDELGQRAQIAVVLGDIAAPGVAEKLVSAAEETGLTLARPDAQRRRAGRPDRRRPQPGQPGAGVGAESHRRAAPARRDRRQRTRLVGRLLVDVVAAGRTRAGRLRRRQRLARRPGRLATGVGIACHHDQLGPVVRHRRGPLADVQCAGPDFAGRGHRGAGGHPGRPAHQHRGGPAAAGPGRGRLPGDSAARLLRRSWPRNSTSTTRTTTGPAPTRCANWTPPR